MLGQESIRLGRASRTCDGALRIAPRTTVNRPNGSRWSRALERCRQQCDDGASLRGGGSRTVNTGECRCAIAKQGEVGQKWSGGIPAVIRTGGRPLDSANRGHRMDSEVAELIGRARESLQRAYAPYSHFKVAAAVRDEQGRVFTGVNVENISYGLSMCAERVAIFGAISAGARRLTSVAVTSDAAELLSPCGACRQVIAQFASGDTPVYCAAGAGELRRWTVAQLLPSGFAASQLGS
ncbi:MAG: cytidine deaminase [Steroidobacteraceae bacterium]